MIRFSPPLGSRPVIFQRGNGHTPDQSHFLRSPQLVLEGTLYSTFSPPKSHDTFSRFPTSGIQNKPSLRQEQRAQWLTSWVENSGWGGGFLWKAVVVEKFVSSLESCRLWVSKRRAWDVPRILPGCPRPLSGTFRNPQPLVVSQKHSRYKWEAYCGTTKRRVAVQIGCVLRRFPLLKV